MGKNNSIIFRDPDCEYLIDLTTLGIIKRENTNIQITQANHNFIPGDVLAYFPKEKKFVLAQATNTIKSEACGVVSECLDENTFIMVTQGYVKAPQYNFPNNSTLWLSEFSPGKLISISPLKVFKKIGIQISSGIINVEMEIGLTTEATITENELIFCTKEDLDEIIANTL